MVILLHVPFTSSYGAIEPEGVLQGYLMVASTIDKACEYVRFIADMTVAPGGSSSCPATFSSVTFTFELFDDLG